MEWRGSYTCLHSSNSVWAYREGPVQLTTLLPNATGVQELEEFRCYMTGDAHHRVDLVQSFEVGGTPPLTYTHARMQV